jgi:hypothetical protein
MDKSKKIVAVIGGRDVVPGLLAVAEDVGKRLAEEGFTVMTGGLTGVMEAASKGAAKAGGLTLAILPGDDRASANKYVTISVATGMGIARNVIIAKTADALIAVGGQYGTLSEIAHALQLGKPVAGIGSWDIDGVEAVDDAERAVEHILKTLGIS